MDGSVALVTGGFGNVGGAIARGLLARGERVRTLTSRTPESTGEIDVRPLDFDRPGALASAFEGVDTFYNTFWMRTGSGGGRSYDIAIERSRALIEAATAAGTARIVHLSVAKPSLDSPYPYFRAKAQIEEAVGATGLPSTIIRPALIFGGDSAMLHDLARVLRRAPVFGIAGDGSYRVRPVHVDDVAKLCIDTPPTVGATVVDAVGPERPTFRELVEQVREAIGSRSRLLRLPPTLVLGAARILGAATGRELMTPDELRSTMDGLADTEGPATGQTLLSRWLVEHGASLGR